MDYNNLVGNEKSRWGNLDLNVALRNLDLDLV